jgi:hypothetical protein
MFSQIVWGWDPLYHTSFADSSCTLIVRPVPWLENYLRNLISFVSQTDSVKSLVMMVSIPLVLSTRSFIPLPYFILSRRYPPVLIPSLVLFHQNSAWVTHDVFSFVIVVHYESRKRELTIRLMNEGRCDERLKARVEESTCLLSHICWVARRNCAFDCCLLWIDKVRAKDKTYIWVLVWWKTTN